MIEYVEKTHEKYGGVDVYQIHDAILFNNKCIKNSSEIIQYVKDKLGFEVLLQSKRYP